MIRYKIIVAYDGTDYEGWQIQPNQRAVANALQNSFAKVFNKEIHLVGASRTDAGVHALGQVAMFNSDLVIKPEVLHQAWTNLLPCDISIRSLSVVSEDFHPQRNVKQKTYWYHFFQQRPLPFGARYGYFMRYPVDMLKLQECLNVFIGTYDFRSFCTGYEMEDTIRTIDSAKIYYVKKYGAYRVEVKGPRFLRYMIRRVVGACLHVASRNDLTPATLVTALAAKDPQQILPTAPARGLMLYKIIYI